MTKRVLVVEDDEVMLEVLRVELGIEEFEVIRSESLSRAFQRILDSSPIIILADYELQDGTAFDLLAWLKARDIRIPLIVLAAHATFDLAVEAVKHGAEYFIPKPVDLELLGTVLRRTLEHSRGLQKDFANKLERARYERDPFLGTSAVIRELKSDSERISQANTPILIQGETGVGKGVLARWLHKRSQRSHEPFIDLNCAGLSSELLQSELFGHEKGAFTGALMAKVGFLEAANHGTLFLDEIGDMDLHVQPKILTVVEDKRFYRLGDVRERTVDIQIIAATHRDLKKQAEQGGFRKDLYFRISTLCLRIPPLRERLEDIPIITDTLLDQFSWEMKRGRLRISNNARVELQQYSWPGNIRELRNVLERAALLSNDGLIDKTGLELEPAGPQLLPRRVIVKNLTLKEMEKDHIVQALESEGGNVTQTARRLGIPRSSLYAKIREYGI